MVFTPLSKHQSAPYDLNLGNACLARIKTVQFRRLSHSLNRFKSVRLLIAYTETTGI